MMMIRTLALDGRCDNSVLTIEHVVFMAALWNRTGPYIFCPVVLLLSIYLLFSSSILSRRRLDVYHTSTWCGPSANLGCSSET